MIIDVHDYICEEMPCNAIDDDNMNVWTATDEQETRWGKSERRDGAKSANQAGNAQRQQQKKCNSISGQS